MYPVLIIDPGHGGRDQGGGSNDRFLEKDMNLQISQYQYIRCKDLGIPVIMTRENDAYLVASDRARKVRESGAIYCISNHINSGGGHGCETIHSIFNDGILATDIYESLIDTGMPGRRVFTRKSTRYPGRDFYYMHRLTGAVTTIIVEYGFADNQWDTSFIVEHWQELAEATIKAFCNYAEYEYKEPGYWKKEGIVRLHELGILDDKEEWLERLEEPMPVWTVTSLLAKMYDKLNQR